MPCGKKHQPKRRMKLIHHEEQRYNVGQAKKHLKHHKGVKLLERQIKAQHERTEKE